MSSLIKYKLYLGENTICISDNSYVLQWWQTFSSSDMLRSVLNAAIWEIWSSKLLNNLITTATTTPKIVIITPGSVWSGKPVIVTWKYKYKILEIWLQNNRNTNTKYNKYKYKYQPVSEVASLSSWPGKGARGGKYKYKTQIQIQNTNTNTKRKYKYKKGKCLKWQACHRDLEKVQERARDI